MEQITSSLAPPRAPTANKAGPPASSQAGAGSIAKRLGNELMTLMASLYIYFAHNELNQILADVLNPRSPFPKSDSNLFDWAGTIEGASGTVYSGLTFKLSIYFPPNYPYVAPVINFETPCFHPNVDINSGAICLDILQDKWSAVYSVQTILISLQSLLGEPNNASPLNPDAASLWNNQEAFKTQLLRCYRPVKDEHSA
ncbi:hypothetical protein D9757_001684 [Collybiopsis confluens]|uniref:UBC core domain-containing protein n=1 Tax=Collybiopsis confluens TaxID=2823264 RepID=A0A8H5HYX5_9AGAR|nr:hypothetical protein D9757_001684 [Collybiopsis confluens]